LHTIIWNPDLKFKKWLDGTADDSSTNADVCSVCPTGTKTLVTGMAFKFAQSIFL
jgi:hypothetical protein